MQENTVNKHITEFFRSKDSKINRDFAVLLSSYFGTNFGNYLKKRLKKIAPKVNLIQFFIGAFDDSDDGEKEMNYENLFEVIGIPMLEYLLLNTFGKYNPKQKLAKVTPFMKSVSTGNKMLDKVIFDSLLEIIDDDKVRKEFMKGLEPFFKNLFQSIQNDNSRAKKFIQKYLDDKKANEHFEQLEKKLISEGKLDEVKRLFSIKSKLTYARRVQKLLPKLKRSLKNQIDKKIFKMEYAQLKRLSEKKDFEALAEIVTEPILKSIFKTSRRLYFKNDKSIAKMSEIMEKIFLSDITEKTLEKNIKKFLIDDIKRKEDASSKKKK